MKPAAEVWMNPQEADPESRDLVDPDYLPARERPSTSVANGSRLVRGTLKWNWKKL